MTYTFPYDRLKLAVIALASILLTAAAAGVLVMVAVGRGEAAQAVVDTASIVTAGDLGLAAVAVSGALLFGGLALTAARFLLREGPVLTIDEGGILDRRVGRRIPWTAVRTVTLKGRGLHACLAVAVDDSAAFLRRRSVWSRLAGIAVRSRRPVVLVNVGALACRPESVALAIEACGGVPVLRAPHPQALLATR